MDLTVTRRSRAQLQGARPWPEISGPHWKIVPTRAWVYLSVCKPRIVGLLLLVTAVSYTVASRGDVSAGPLTLLMAAGAFAASGAAVLNGYLERDLDAVMPRTSRRPLAAGVVAHPALIPRVGVACILVGSLLALLITPLVAAAVVGGATIYVLLYTVMLKRRTHWSVAVGGLCGSCAVLAGWLAAAPLSTAAVLVAALLFTWQLAHFWPLAMARTDDYERAGIPMLPAAAGHRQAVTLILLAAVATVGISLAFGLVADLGRLYIAGSFTLGALWLGVAARLLVDTREQTAWLAFKASGVYLAATFLLMLLAVALAV